MRTHELKTWPSYFDSVERGYKTFEVRKNDRDYASGDLLVLREFDPAVQGAGIAPGRYTGRTLTVEVTHVLHGGRFGLDPAWCVLGIKPLV